MVMGIAALQLVVTLVLIYNNNNDNNSYTEIEARYKKILKLKAEIARIEAKAISSVVHQNKRVFLSEAQNHITIGRDEACNLRIDNRKYVASIHCTISIVSNNNLINHTYLLYAHIEIITISIIIILSLLSVRKKQTILRN